MASNASRRHGRGPCRLWHERAHAGASQDAARPYDIAVVANEAIAGFAQTHLLPLAVVGTSRALPTSGLMAFGPARDEYAQLAARYVDRLLDKPGDLAIEQTTRFSLVLNLKAAKTLGVIVSQGILRRADEVIQ